MAILWVDGFDHYGGSTTNLYKNRYVKDAGQSIYGFTSSSRTGSHALRLGSYSFLLPLISYETEIGVGYAAYASEFPFGAYYYRFLELYSSTGVVIFQVRGESTGRISINTSTNGATFTQAAITSQSYIRQGFWQHLEIYCKSDGGSSLAEIRFNGSTVLSSTITLPSTAGFSQIGIRGTSVNDTMFVDDLYVWNAQGTKNNTFIGDKRVETLYPNADTAQADWTITGTVSGWDAINDATPDSDTSYIQAATASSTSTFDVTNLSISSGNIIAVQNSYLAKKTEAGTCDVRVDAVSNSVASVGTQTSLTTEYSYFSDVHETDPNTSSDWTVTSVNSMNVKINRVA